VDGSGDVRTHACLDRGSRNPGSGEPPGFRVASLVVVTTLADARRYSATDLGALYGCRWLVELDIRAIKISLDLDVCGAKPRDGSQGALVGLLAYNLLRRSLLQAALATGRSPRHLSFSAALQATAASWQVPRLEQRRPRPPTGGKRTGGSGHPPRRPSPLAAWNRGP